MSTTPLKPRRTRNAAPRDTPKPVEPSAEAIDAPEPSVHQADNRECAAPAQHPEQGAEHALELTLEALSVDHQTAERIQKLPHDVGWLLVTAGIVGVVMPGVIGVPFLALGGLILWPGTHRKAEHWLSGHSPKIFKGSMRQINRFLDDLERRYPRADKRKNT